MCSRHWPEFVCIRVSKASYGGAGCNGPLECDEEEALGFLIGMPNDV